MKKVMQFVKVQWMLLLSGTVALAAIVFCAMGMMSDKVTKDMKKKLDEIGASSINSLIAKPQNEATIAAEQQRGKLFEEEYKKTVAVANSINGREVLMPGVFPTPEKAATPFEFRAEYRKAVAGLYKPMNGGTLPTPAEVQEEAQNIDDLLLLEQEKRVEVAADDTNRTPVVAGPAISRQRTFTGGAQTGGRSLGGRSMGGRSMGGRSMGGGMPGGAGINMSAVNSGDPKYNPDYRARVNKAKNILCYYDDTTFHVSPIFQEDPTSPPPEEMWFAQVGLWIQEDVVRAVAELNRKAADEVKDTEACVENVPVKHLESVRVIGYFIPPNEQTPSGVVQFMAMDAMPTITGGPSLSGRVGDAQFDVLRFVVTVVLDQRDILQFIDQMSKVNFYQCINMRYEKVDPLAAQAEGYFYGTAPAVRATIEFEGYMSREVYEPLMPKEVRKLLGIAAE